jgi:hypothetical protein
VKPVDNFAAAYAYAAMPARLALERSDWKEAMDLPLHPAAEAYPWKKYPQAEAVNAFARGIGAARSGDAAAAREQQSRLVSLRDTAKEAKLAYWAEQIDIQAEIVGSLALCAEGKPDACIESLANAAAREDATEKHVVTPGPIIPAREMLADILAASGKTTEALREYEEVLAKEPNRYRAVLGASRAARSAGQEARARDLFKQHAPRPLQGFPRGTILRELQMGVDHVVMGMVAVEGCVPRRLRGGAIRLDRLAPKPEAREDVRRHVQGVRRVGRDLRVKLRGLDAMLRDRWIVVAVDQVVGDARMVRIGLRERLQDARRLQLVRVCLVGRVEVRRVTSADRIAASLSSG